MPWNRQRALRLGKARTRDGRDVINLQEATLDGRQVLIGVIIQKKRPYPDHRCLKTEHAYWERGGLGFHGGDDLLDAPD